MGFLKRLSIRVQLLIIVLMIVIIIFFVILSNYIKVANDTKQKNNEYLADMISQIRQTISSNCDVLNRLVQNTSYSMLVQNYLNETDPTKKFEQYSQVKDYITNLYALKDGIQDVALLGRNGTVFNIKGDIGNVFKYEGEIPPNALFYYTSKKTIPYDNIDRNCFIVGSHIYSTTDFEKIGEEIGTLMVFIDIDALIGKHEQMNVNSTSLLYMLDREGFVFYTNDDAVKVGDRYLKTDAGSQNILRITGPLSGYNMQTGDIPMLDGEIIFKISQDELLRGLADIQKQQLVILSIALGLLSVPLLVVINNIIQPLNKFMKFMNEIKDGKLKNLKKRISLQGYQEITVMADDFNKMLDEIDDLTHRLLDTNKRLYEAELLKRQAEMAYLQSQINPHFLYNTLESIKGIAAKEHIDAIFNMAKALGHVFKYSIKGSDTVTCEEELNSVKSYLYIQKIRFGSRLNVVYNIEEGVLNCRVLKMILQPIVENAIYHGIEPKDGTGQLEIIGYISGNKLNIDVNDDGVGMDAEKLKSIDLKAAGPFLGTKFETDRNYSIGLANVHERIRLNYGQEYGVQIESSPGTGTKVKIILPYQE